MKEEKKLGTTEKQNVFLAAGLMGIVLRFLERNRSVRDGRRINAMPESRINY